jgi:putative spermidine/putrescine transport system ATP-binding protein
MPSGLVVEGLVAGYLREPALHGLDVAVGRGELVSLLGPSGCGKTTTMRAIAGLLPARGGRVVLDGKELARVPPHRREIGLVFQSYALFPHLDVRGNVGFGLRLRKVAADELRRRVDAALAAVGLEALAARLPSALSGGQQQRVALARALVLRPRLLLLDEPLSNLDARLRLEMRAELRRLQRELGVPMLYVTHDQSEALALSDRIVVLREGRVEQAGTPEDVFHRPRSAFVASFMGYENQLDLDGRRLAWRPDQVAVRAPGAGAVAGTVLARSYGGDRIEYLVQTALGRVKGLAGESAPWREGDAVALDLDPGRAVVLG